MHEQPCNLAVQNTTDINNLKQWVEKVEKSNDTRYDSLEKRIRSIEVRIAFIAGGAAAAGGTIGGLIGKNFDKVACVIEILKGVIYG